MKKLYKNIILFLLPVIVLLILLPVNKRYKYQGLKNDCYNHAIWIYDRIFNNNKPADIVFLGSSHTINGINDKLIEKELDNNISVVNFGYCRLGRNLSYALLKEVIEEKQPKYLVLEIREDEDRYSHDIFPYISPSYDVIFANPLFNRDFLIDIYNHLSYKIELTQDEFYRHLPEPSVRVNDYGFSSSKDTALVELLKESKLKRSVRKPELSQVRRDFYMCFSRIYLKKIHKLCINNDIRIYFLYIPSYGRYLEKPKEFETYNKYGEVLIPSREIFRKQSNWHDENHLNQSGAKELSLWFVNFVMR